MRASTVLGLAALFKATIALPATNAEDSNDEPAPTITEAPVLAKRADATALWVSVDDEGRPATTLTPSVTTGDDGSTGMADAAPHDLTASVFTSTYYGIVATSTGDPPNPTATNKHTEGAFSRCYNEDGDNKPLCYPKPSSTLYKDTIYYITWDPDYFNKTDNGNATLEVAVRLDYLNRTTDEEAPDYSDTDDWEDGEFTKLDQTDRVPAEWGFLPLKIGKSYLKGPRPHNITLTLMVGEKGSSAINETSDAIPLVFDTHRAPAPESTHVENRDLIIALPVTVGSILFIVFGIFLWNRKTRRIQLGNIMSRSRHGYTGRKARRIFHRNKGGASGGGAIRLEERNESPPLYEYSDHAVPEPPQRPRRDSDLGSLAGSPITPTFQDQDTMGGSNAFRDELRRQDEQRKYDRY